MKNELVEIEKRFRIANYLSVVQNYLKDNFFLVKDLKEEDLKPQATGHFGVSPAINFIYAHINSYARRNEKNIQYIIGEGHAGSAVLINLFLDGEISKYYSQYPYNIDGLKKLIKNFGTKNGFRTEINPYYPSTIYDGGELGYSLPTAIGASIKDENILYVCVIGDGEAETGTISASWFLNKAINKKIRGNVLPILNLNGLKMGSRSIFSMFSDIELNDYFSSLGYKVYIVNANNEEMYNALENLNYENNNIIIVKSKKGWTAINTEKMKVEGEIISHKNPLGKIENVQDKIEYLEKWLKSYNINEKTVSDVLKKKSYIRENSISKEIKKVNNKKYDKSLKSYEIKDTNTSNIKAIGKMINDIISDDNDFFVFSPDELESNLLQEIIKYNNNNVIEILNENICQALFFGHINNHKRGIMISYEAFMPIITSMISQLQKYIFQSQKVKWRKKMNSMTYVLTSVCWENNYSHQNPEFLSSMLSKEYDFVNVYTPIDSNSLVVTLDKCINEKNTINIIDISKRNKKQYKTLKQAKKSINEGMEIFYETKKDEFDICLVAIGDYLIEEVEEAKLKLEDDGKKIRILYVSKINSLKNLSEKKIQYYFGNLQPILIVTHTYANIIKGLLFNIKERKIIVEGYKDKSNVSANYKLKLEKNELSGNDIYIKAKELLEEK